MANRNLSDYQISEIVERLKARLYGPLRTVYRRTAPSRLLLARSYLLDDEWYLQQYPDVVDAKTSPTKHYLRHGARENRDPGPFFSTAWYRAQYPDVGQTSENPLVHFLRVGEAEGRLTGPSFRRRRGKFSKTSSQPNQIRALRQKKLAAKNLKDQLDSFLSESEYLDFSKEPELEKQPTVSAVIVTWNKAEFTLATLRSLAHDSHLNMEVIIVDNGSTDETLELLQRVRGARTILNSENQGFVKAVNSGANLASGKYLLLINNDAVPREGAITKAAAYLDENPECGAVGGRLVLPSGLLQEAGSIIWQDGSCVGYLRNEPPEIGEAMFVRSVDFCSAAFLMIRKSKWDELGGFNERYSPAYYEEVDFCCRLIASGSAVIYLPQVVVDHFEFASTEGLTRAAEMQVERREIFKELNKNFLAKQLAPTDSNLSRARNRDHRLSVLVIDDQVPRESAGQGFPRTVRLLKALSRRGYRATVAATAHEGVVNWPAIWAELGDEIECVPDLTPRTLEAFLEERQGSYDLLWISRPHNLKYVSEIAKRRPSLVTAPVIYDAEALTTSNLLGGGGDKIDLEQLKAISKRETDLTELASAIVCVSELDASVFQTNTNKPTFVAAHSLEAKPGSKPFEERHGVLFFGALTNIKSPNVEGMEWFLTEVWPLISDDLKASNPMGIAGQILPSLARKWTQRHVEVLGLVPDLYSLANQYRVFIAPTRRAQGIPIKVLEAASYGLPSVITPILAQQLQWKDGREALIASTPQLFADRVSELLINESLWRGIRNEASVAVTKTCDPAAFDQSVLGAIDLVLNSAEINS